MLKLFGREQLVDVVMVMVMFEVEKKRRKVKFREVRFRRVKSSGDVINLRPSQFQVNE